MRPYLRIKNLKRSSALAGSETQEGEGGERRAPREEGEEEEKEKEGQKAVPGRYWNSLNEALGGAQAPSHQSGFPGSHTN